MRQTMLVLLFLAIAGCSDIQQVDHDVVQLQQQQDALSAAIKKIKVVSGATVDGGTHYTKLGSAQGFCFNLPNSTGGQLTHGAGLKAAAYRQYGDQVDAIVNTTVWFVSDDAYAPYEPYTENGYYECAGTAVHFATKPPPGISSGG